MVSWSLPRQHFQIRSALTAVSEGRFWKHCPAPHSVDVEIGPLALARIPRVFFLPITHSAICLSIYTHNFKPNSSLLWLLWLCLNWVHSVLSAHIWSPAARTWSQRHHGDSAVIALREAGFERGLQTLTEMLSNGLVLIVFLSGKHTATSEHISTSVQPF